MILHDSDDRIPGDARRVAAAFRSRPARAQPPGRSGDAHLVEEFAAAWERGERPAAEVFLDRHPRLADAARSGDPIDLRGGLPAAERRSGRDALGAGAIDSPSGRPSWRCCSTATVSRGHAGPAGLARSRRDAGRFRPLGRAGPGGAGALFPGGSTVALVPSSRPQGHPDDHVEHLSLARLQHTHIMPLYSEHEFPARRLRALCMPYLGGTTLARILAELQQRSGGRAVRGRSLLDVLDRAQEASPWPQSGREPGAAVPRPVFVRPGGLLDRRVPGRCACSMPTTEGWSTWT